MVICMASKPFLPRSLPKLPLAAAEIIAQNQELIALCQGGDSSLEKLRAFVARDRS